MKTFSFRRCVLPLLAVALHAESELCVVVRDPSGLAAPQSFVTIEPQAAAAILSGTTREDGRMCQSVSPGEYIIRVTHGSFMGSASAVSIAAGAGRIEHEFVLR